MFLNLLKKLNVISESWSLLLIDEMNKEDSELV